MAKVLVVDDEANIRKTLKEILEDQAHEVCLAEDGEKGLKVFESEEPDVVLLDIQLPGRDGLSVLKDIRSRKSNAEVIMITGHGNVESAVIAIKTGAFHFLQKPLSMIEVRQNVLHAAEKKHQKDELNQWRQSEEARYQLIGKSRPIEAVREQILKVAPTNGRILITGESGTGKEVVAYSIHKHSGRKDGPFVKINCAAIPQNLIESELFGHEKGAFTGALSQKKGKFEVADKGTLLLDEIGDMDMSTQTKVLRAIQESEFERVGGVKTLKVDVRIIAATHRDLEAMINEGTFREDLFYRLNVVPIHVPSLTERGDDIALLAEHFLKRYCAENGMSEKVFSKEALAVLKNQKLSGNIRELRNIVERLAILSDSDIISPEAMGLNTQSGQTTDSSLFMQPKPLHQAKEDLEKKYVEAQLDLNGWDIAKTADILGILRNNLHRKIKQLGIEKK